MFLRAHLLQGTLVLLLSVAGCAVPANREGYPGWTEARRPENALTLPEIPRGSIEAGLSEPPAMDAVDRPGSEKPPAYRALTARQCQCMAVDAASRARLQEEEQQLAGELAPKTHCFGRGKRRSAALKQELLGQAILEEKNRAAGAALEMYYRLGEAEGKVELLTRSQAILADSLDRTRKMLDQKLRPPVELEVWTRQDLTSRSERARLQQAIRQLNSELRLLLGLCGADEDWRIWNPVGYRVTPEQTDAEAAVRLGLESRPELAALRLALHSLDGQTLPAVRQLLRTVNGTLGEEENTSLLARLTGKRRNAAELATRRRQLAEHLHSREQAVSEEVRLAVHNVQTRLKLMVLARERERGWQSRIQDLQGRHERGLASFAELHSARLEGIKARGELLEEMMAWHIAGVKLKQAQGVLALECSEEECARPLQETLPTRK